MGNNHQYNRKYDIHVDYSQTARGWEVVVRNTGGTYMTYSVHDDEYDAISDWMDIAVGDVPPQKIIDKCRVMNATTAVINRVMNAA